VQKKKFTKTLGAHLMALRKKHGLTQCDLAFACGKGPQSIERVENGKFNSTAYYLFELSKALDIPLKDLLDF
jgi:transcriptional regulator with XRE-family HTH domain